jgi:hypothetical protein
MRFYYYAVHKEVEKHPKEWALETSEWHLEGMSGTFDISGIEDSEEVMEKYRNATFYKERWIKEDGLEQKLIVTFSLKYKEYQHHIRYRQVDRATKLLDANPSDLKKPRSNDYKRFITKTNVTNDGEIAEKEVYSINQDAIANEEAYDGFYEVCTNLEDDAPVLTKFNHKRWEIKNV